MASIHDVAKMAQVSTATVSKHLNKAGYVSPEKREAIDQAVATLGYAINRNARMLKTKQSSDILFIVPNMLERIYREMAESTTSILGEEYRVIIQLSQDNPHRERKILQECLNNPCAGILLVTCIPEDTQLLLRVRSQIPMIFLHRQPQDLTNCSFFGFNHFDTIYGLASELYRLGHHDIGLFVGDSKFSCEQECIRGFAAMLQSKGIGAPANRIFSAPLNKDTTFRSVMRLFDSGDYPKVFLCSSTLTAQAINDVAYFRRLDIGRDLFVFALGEDSWYNSIFVNRIISTYRDARKIGSLAATSLKELIQSPLIYEPLHVELNDEFAIHWINRFLQRLEANATIRPKLQPTCSLKIAFNAGDAGADALRSLISQYANQHQVKVELDILPHHQLHETIVDMAERKSADYDLFAVDAPWLSHLHSMGVVHDLTDLATPTDILTNLAPKVMENVGSCNHRIFGIPHTYSLQLMFYRKDLFADPDLAQAFYNRYHVELAPPTNWNMFNIISNFFTRENTANSPTPYGTSLFGSNNSAGICTELYPKMSAYNGTIFDNNGHVRLYTQEVRKAYQSLLDTIADAPPDTLNDSAFQGLQRLMDGETAMCISFSNNACYFLDSYANFFQENIGYAPVPGKKPIISGWSTSINAHSQNKELAWDFIQWFSGLEIASAFTLMGGAAPMTSLLQKESLVQMYPWYPMTVEQYHTGTRREAPTIHGAKQLNPSTVEDILASVVYTTLEGNISLETALFRAHRQLCQYAEANGYPKNIMPSQATIHRTH